MITVEEIINNVVVDESSTRVIDTREVVLLTINNSGLPPHTHEAIDIEPTSIEWGQFDTFLYS